MSTSQQERMVLKLPAQAPCETEATIVTWFVESGARVAEGDVLAEAESGKATFSLESPCAATVLRVLHDEGTIVSFDTPVVELAPCDIPSAKHRRPNARRYPDTTASRILQAMPAPTREQPRNDTNDCLLSGFGYHLPVRSISNEDLASRMTGVDADYLTRVTGVRNRYWASSHETAADLACKAARMALDEAERTPQEIDAMIVATTTPDQAMPAVACVAQHALGLRNVPCFDLNAACSGWLYSLSVARDMIVARTANNVLVIGVEMLSRYLDQSDYRTTCLFGDAAGATIVSRAGRGHTLGSVGLNSFPEHLGLAHRSLPIASHSSKTVPADPWIHLDGPALFRVATRTMGNLITEAAASRGWEMDDVDWLVPHQANARIILAAAQRCGLPAARVVSTLDQVGNTGSASIPLAIALSQESFAVGDKIILCSMGAGLTTGFTTLQW